MKYADRQRADFLGHGGMLTLYLAPDPKTASPELKVPLLFRSMPCYSEDDSRQIQALYSMQDKFLAQSKEAFGEPFRGDSNYKGLMFVLPLFTSASLLASTFDQRALWFEVFEGYFIESKVDCGMLLVLKDPHFDEALAGLLRGMKEDGFVYRG
jgi:hypothetical protein